MEMVDAHQINDFIIALGFCEKTSGGITARLFS
jgi:hypothetical protein